MEKLEWWGNPTM